MLLFSLLALVSAQLTTHLHLHHVSPSDTLLQFTIQNQDQIDFQAIL